MSGWNTLSGGFVGLTTSIAEFNVSGYNTINGDIADFPLNNLYSFTVTGSNTISGTLASWAASTKITTISITGSNTVSGAVSNIPVNVTSFTLGGYCTLTGDLGDIPSKLVYFVATGRNTISDYTTKTWTVTQMYFQWGPQSGYGLSSAEVDQLLIDFADDITWTGSYKMVFISGPNARTSASDAAVTHLTSVHGVQVYTPS